jgi:intergrase/recombinase
MKKDTYTKAMEIVELLINSGLSISDQLQVIKNVKERLEFCKNTGLEISQYKINFK